MNVTMMSKAIVAVIGGILSLLEVFGLVKIADHEGLVTTISAVLTPLLVWLVPNTAVKG